MLIRQTSQNRHRRSCECTICVQYCVQYSCPSLTLFLAISKMARIPLRGFENPCISSDIIAGNNEDLRLREVLITDINVMGNLQKNWNCFSIQPCLFREYWQWCSVACKKKTSFRKLVQRRSITFGLVWKTRWMKSKDRISTLVIEAWRFRPVFKRV